MTACGSVWLLWVLVNCTMTMSLWQCLLALSTNQPLLQQIGKLPAQADVTCSVVLLQLCMRNRPSILLISSSIWCRFWLISTPLMSESNQRKNRRENCWTAASQSGCVHLRYWACEVRGQVRDTESDNEKAIAVLAGRCSEILEGCSKLFSIL